MQTVLVVEDDPVVVEITGEILHELGYRVLQAMTAQEALGVARLEKVDMVLLDKTLPDMSGLEIVPQLLAMQPNLRIVLCSGDAMLASGDEGLPPGIVDNLPKPFSMEDMKAVLARNLG